MITSRTKIIQVSADNITDAAEKMAHSSTHEKQCIIVMLKRNYNCCCCEVKFDVPANFTVLEEVCGEA